jgi:hypothetical protein
MSDEDARRPTHGALAVDAGDVGDACATENATPQALLDMVRLVRARERGYLASLLHDGPIQELAVVALELGEVCRAMGASPSDKPNGLVWQVHAAGRTLCRLQEELWPFPHVWLRLGSPGLPGGGGSRRQPHPETVQRSRAARRAEAYHR